MHGSGPDAAPDRDAGDPGATLARRQWLPADAAPGRRVLLVDSITQLGPADAGAVVIAGSHGGRSAALYALAHPMTLVVFNDAGVGKDQAGIAALPLMQAQGRAAATVAHDSARIGDALDAWRHGMLSHVNPLAAAMGLAPGLALRVALAHRPAEGGQDPGAGPATSPRLPAPPEPGPA